MPVKRGQVFRGAIRTARQRKRNTQKHGLSAGRKVGPKIALNISASTFDAFNKE